MGRQSDTQRRREAEELRRYADLAARDGDHGAATLLRRRADELHPPTPADSACAAAR